MNSNIKYLVKVFFKDDSVKVVDKKQWEFLRGIKNATKNQIKDYRFILA